MKLLKIVSIFVFALIIGLNVNTKSVEAQDFVCPPGWVCTQTSPTPTSSPTPSIKIISPNGGEKLYAGQTYPIKWTASNLPQNTNISFQLSYRTKSGLTYEDVFEINPTSNTGIFNWNIPTKYLDMQPNYFKLRVLLTGPSIPGTNVPQDYSDSFFTIISSGSSPSPTPTSTNSPKPVITSINPTLGVIDSVVKIEGYNLLDRRGEQNIVIENSRGEVAYLGFGNADHVDLSKKQVRMNFILKKEACKGFSTDRGLCTDGFMTISPGEYNIYVKSILDNFISNKVKLTVIQSSYPSSSPTQSPIANQNFYLKEVYPTGYAFKSGDVMTLNTNPTYIPSGYSVTFEAWNETDTKRVANISKVNCTRGNSCVAKANWTLKKNLFNNGDRQFVIRAILKKGSREVNTVKTGKLYVIAKDQYTSTPVMSTAPTSVTSPVQTTSPTQAVYSSPSSSVSVSSSAPIQVALSSSKLSYRQDEKIVSTFKVYNNTDSDITLNFKNGCPRVSYVVNGYDSASSVICPNEPGPSVNVMAKGSYSWQVVHDPISYKIPVGDHSFTARLNITNKELYPGAVWSATLPVKITSTNTSSVIDSLKSFFETVF